MAKAVMERLDSRQVRRRTERRAIPKSITITSRQQRFIEARSINLSKFLQKKLDDEIAMQGWQGEDGHG